MAEDVNYARRVFNSVKEASTAAYKEGFIAGGFTYTTNFTTNTISGTFSLPIVQSEDATTGGINFEVADFLADPTPASVQ